MIHIGSKRFLHLSHNVWKTNVPIKWVRPEKIPCYLPEKSGDLKPLLTVDLREPGLEFRDSEELKTADERVKRIFSLEFLPRKKTLDAIKHEYLNRVKRHNFDEKSPEARVARMTANIRDMQRHVEKFPYDAQTRARLKEAIDKRKKLLKLLRTWDYKCFEYLLEKLDLVYKPFPPPDVYRRIERKRSIRMLTKEYCDNIISNRLSEYRASLEAQQESFLTEKINTLKWVMEEEKECGAVPTVSEYDIQATEQLLNEVKKKKKFVNIDHLD